MNERVRLLNALLVYTCMCVALLVTVTHGSYSFTEELLVEPLTDSFVSFHFEFKSQLERNRTNTGKKKKEKDSQTNKNSN